MIRKIVVPDIDNNLFNESEEFSQEEKEFILKTEKIDELLNQPNNLSESL